MNRHWFKTLGPGLLYAGAAVGVSHLIQSTRAGADFGYQLVWAIVIAIILKYPTFEFGPRYASATGKNLLHGYQALGKWSVVLFFCLTLLSMFIIQAAVTIVTAGLFAEIFNIHLPAWSVSALILLVCCLILVIGKYSALDKTMKIIIITLSITTFFAFFAALLGDNQKHEALMNTFSFSNKSHILFLIALMGWMPAPFDISVWHSIWTTEKAKENPSITFKSTLLDFKIGYWTTLILSLAFLGLGAITLYGSGTELSSNGNEFAKQLLTIYTTNIGQWAYFIIAIAALTTMISTTLTCLDAQPRVMTETSQLIFGISNKQKDNAYWFWLITLILGAVSILFYFLTNMKAMIDVATAIAFLTSPIIAILNYLVITGKTMPEDKKPPLFLKILSGLGILFFLGFSIYYLYITFI
ncbi:MAG: iron transporter [Flavobacteriales bacterium CG_4_9_14_0_2_um_filter_32_27]|nr:MAG: iron transporter [Flavobacteriales bacterium CG_4_9_14_0_2_um_filter_32_27]